MQAAKEGAPPPPPPSTPQTFTKQPQQQQSGLALFSQNLKANIAYMQHFFL